LIRGTCPQTTVKEKKTIQHRKLVCTMFRGWAPG
jgi:hypothetical protein